MLSTGACSPGISREGDANLRLGVAGLFVKGERTSDHFQFVSFDGDGDGALDRFQGDDQVFFAALFQNSFQAIEAAAANPYSLSNL